MENDHKEYFEELDRLNDQGIMMWAAAPMLHEKHPQMSVGECNTIVLDWIEKRGYNVSYTE